MAENWLFVVLIVLAVVFAGAAVLFAVVSVAFALFVYAFVERTEEGIADLSMPSIGRLLLRVGRKILSALGMIAKWIAAIFIVAGVTLLNRLPGPRPKH